MTTGMINGTALRTLYQDNIHDRLSPNIYVKPQPTPAASQPQTTPDSEVTENPTELILRYIAELRAMDPDERLDYVLSANPVLTEEHLQQIVATTDQWLNNEARDRMRAIAQRTVTNHGDPRGILIDWITDEEFTKLQLLLDEIEFPDPILATCYAICEADGVAHATYYIQQDRAPTQESHVKIEQSQEEIEEDLRFVNLK